MPDRHASPEELAAQERLELTRTPRPEKFKWVTALYNHFRKRHFAGMPACPVGIDYRPHWFVLGSYDRTHGIVIRNNPKVIEDGETAAHILLHEMTHQWVTWMCLDVGDPRVQNDPVDADGHSMTFRRKLRSAMAAQFPGRRIADVGASKLRY